MYAGDEEWTDNVTYLTVKFPRHTHQCTCCGERDAVDNPVFYSKAGKCWICDGCDEETTS